MKRHFTVPGGSLQGHGEGSFLASSVWELRPGLTLSFLRSPNIQSTGRQGYTKGFHQLSLAHNELRSLGQDVHQGTASLVKKSCCDKSVLGTNSVLGDRVDLHWCRCPISRGQVTCRGGSGPQTALWAAVLHSLRCFNTTPVLARSVCITYFRCVHQISRSSDLEKLNSFTWWPWVTRLTKLGPVQVFYTLATGLDILEPGCTAGSSGRLVRDRFLELVSQGGLGSQNLGLSVPRDSSSRTGICDHCSRPHFSLEMVCELNGDSRHLISFPHNTWIRPHEGKLNYWLLLDSLF